MCVLCCSRALKGGLGRVIRAVVLAFVRCFETEKKLCKVCLASKSTMDESACFRFCLF